MEVLSIITILSLAGLMVCLIYVIIITIVYHHIVSKMKKAKYNELEIHSDDIYVVDHPTPAFLTLRDLMDRDTVKYTVLKPASLYLIMERLPDSRRHQTYLHLDNSIDKNLTDVQDLWTVVKDKNTDDNDSNLSFLKWLIS